jgi:hypothetical protein
VSTTIKNPTRKKYQMKIKIMEILGTKSITSRKNGKQYQVVTFKDDKGIVMDTFNKIEVGREYEGEVTNNQYGVSFRVTTAEQTSTNKQVELLTEILEIEKQILAKIGSTPKSDTEREVSWDEDPPVEDEELVGIE